MLVVPGFSSGPTLTVLGSGTLVPDDGRHGAAHLVRSRDVRLLLDCGPGTLHGFDRYGVPWSALTHVAISHYHNDHIGDLPALMQALKHGMLPRRTRPLTMIGPRGFRSHLERLAGVAGGQVTDPGFEVRVVELGPGSDHREGETGLRVSCMPTPHTRESVAYRVEIGGASIGYTGDTGPSELVSSFLAGCDVLVAECTQPDPPAVPTHLSPLGLAELARTARPGLLVVTHVMPPSSPEEAATLVAAHYEGSVLAARDGLAIPLG